ncbi:MULTISPECIES: acyltransferase family protein [Methylobacterium]|uniref:acyltransferase family protein n=1 Tax=Methylobacterium TaxID=407 RepID=UPI0013EDF2C3|nr:acyltransferase family protein [Methylobacterium sp. DB0501]NGM32713.1 acyltransferase [Methylobacterium sp. DB0501]
MVSDLHRPSSAAPAGRLVALDRMRGFVVGLVVLHHAVLAYCTFGHIDRVHYALSTAPIVDPQRWIGFDLVVLLDDGFFMPLLFGLSGLFVRDGLARKGVGPYLRARLLRLGLAFCVAELTLVPLAYYPSFLQAGGKFLQAGDAPGFPAFWHATVTAGPWPSGPPWFIGVLLLFDAAAALWFVLAPHEWSATPAEDPRPGRDFVRLVAVTILVFLPLLLAVGPRPWFAVGPLAVQGSRIGLYAAYFAAGVGLGRGGGPAIAGFGRALARRCGLWVALAVAAGTVFVAATRLGAAVPRPAQAALALDGIAQAVFCAAACFALPALFLRLAEGRHPAWDSLAANGFAVYLLHYPVVTWTQYGLLGWKAGAVAKGLSTFVVALGASWAGAALLRRSPLVGRVL